MSNYDISDRAAAVDQRRGQAPETLSHAHLRILQHYVRGGIVSGWKRWWDSYLIDLEAWYLMKGEWIGSLAYEAYPSWHITDAGRKLCGEDRP